MKNFDINTIRSKDLQTKLENANKTFKPNVQLMVDTIDLRRKIKSTAADQPQFKQDDKPLLAKKNRSKAALERELN